MSIKIERVEGTRAIRVSEDEKGYSQSTSVESHLLLKILQIQENILQELKAIKFNLMRG